MTTERMTDERREHLAEFSGKWCTSQQDEVNAELTRARRVEQEQAAEVARLKEAIRGMAGDFDVREKRLTDENASLRELLRLANDKMDAQVRQERWEVATEALERLDPASCAGEQYLRDVVDANAPKD